MTTAVETDGGDELSDRIVLVSGGAGGIGACIVASVRATGGRVAVIDQRPAPGADLSIRADVSDPDAVAAAVSEVHEQLGTPTAVVCAAGVVSEFPVESMEPAEWRRVVDVSLTGAFLLMRAVIPGMRVAGGGSIVAMSSGWARRGYPRGAHYAAAKAGVEALVRSLALEVAKDAIRVNAVAPGPIRTPMLDDLPDFDEAARTAVIPLGRLGEPADVVDPILFLLGHESRYLTGQTLHVNGGLTMP